MIAGEPPVAPVVLHVDPCPVWRAGFVETLRATDWRAVGVAVGGEALETLRQTNVDAVVAEFQLPDMQAFDLLERARGAGFRGRCVLLTSELSPNLKVAAQAAGCTAAVAKGIDDEALLATLRKALAGKSGWRKREAPHEAKSPLATHRLSVLTPREIETLRLLTHGKTNRQIADELQISYETVKEHVQHILRKLGVDDRTQAAIWAVQNGLE